MGTRLSVVVATYNRPVLITDLLQALATQSLPAEQFEVVVVDDGSTPPVRPALQALALPYALRVLEQANAGAAAARHAGVLAARGEVVVVTDDDMVVPPDFLEEHLRAHENGYSLVLGAIVEDPRTTARQPVFHRMHAEQLARERERAHARWVPARGSAVCTGNVSFRRSDYLRVGGFDRTLARSEDRELGIRLEKAGARVAFARDARTINHNDVDRREVWIQRNFLYGIYDRRIGQRHPDVESADPWHFLFEVNPVSASLILVTVVAPVVGKVLARAALAAAEALDGLGWERPALAGATLSYGLEYFRGVRHEAGSAWGAVRDLAAFLDKHTCHSRAAAAAV
ncbi:MAG: glycosyltransferase [Deltaproteobacteria bacterium]|nr:glycosyltransferase [Deltaproteobacteria bacterium]